MWSNSQPYLASIMNPFQMQQPDTGKAWEMKLNDGFKPMFSVQTWRHPVEIDRSMIHVYIQAYEMAPGFKLTKGQRYELRPCKESDFLKDDFEREVWEIMKYTSQYCIDDPEETISLKGNFQEVFKGNVISYFTLKVETCNEVSRIEGDPACSSEAQISEWISDKVLELKVLELYFDSSSDTNVMSKLTLTNSIPLDSEKLVCSLKNYRRNIIDSKTEFLKMWETDTTLFYNYEESKQDVFSADNRKEPVGYPWYIDISNNQLIDMMFMYSSYEMHHRIEGKNIVDWISSIGGVFNIFLLVVTIICGSFVTFDQNYTMIKRLDESENKKTTKAKKEKVLPLQKQSFFSKIKLFVSSKMPKCIKNAKDKKIIERMNTKQKQLKEDFNLE